MPEPTALAAAELPSVEAPPSVEPNEPTALADVVPQEPGVPEPDPVPAPAEAPVQDSGEPASVAVPAEPLAAGGPAEDDSEELTPARVPPTDTEPSDKQSTPGGAAALADALLAPTMGEIDEPTDPDSSADPPGPGIPFTEAATDSAVGAHPEQGIDASDAVPIVVATEAAESGGQPGNVALEPTDRVHWAVVATVMLATTASVATLLLLAGHVI